MRARTAERGGEGECGHYEVRAITSRQTLNRLFPPVSHLKGAMKCEKGGESTVPNLSSTGRICALIESSLIFAWVEVTLQITEGASGEGGGVHSSLWRGKKNVCGGERALANTGEHWRKCLTSKCSRTDGTVIKEQAEIHADGPSLHATPTACQPASPSILISLRFRPEACWNVNTAGAQRASVWAKSLSRKLSTRHAAFELWLLDSSLRQHCGAHAGKVHHAFSKPVVWTSAG